ncbi:hypothetical protein A2875_02800 [Candidatus Gottesmanbacteria bacterium RIFCSPHIGHO2_01_FULL_46_14]|uniref:Toxin n=4 Tax=Microgenomates group TaxID=1794810 RepID=A0A1F5ZPX1_9BACT|nr:MAG: hypothetical protein UU34_C0005G0022 [Candidatus Curtissbacteria bacterium GW2011_GWA1_41_11]KKS12392.1 MAG: hypothetical protein UU67_C0054G0002 [Candidatus Daviesbacteria bacterium GW2011_GWB1_41_5]OGG14433.1 MAG: hypothetical protein A2875_02800 [Candidatus Gottesmanbacteria bacterium RIFCSPHIGHO2_01_FULL_46_14]OGG28550.1 MAG: hypothetical protein A2971_03635 [Candidatus Gottesmanbacteria bacterium RIFCSPLOWO2_01_FULL_46_21]
MTRIIVRVLVFDKVNREHIKKHKVTEEEIEVVGKKFLYHRRAHSGRYLAIGRVGQRILTIIIRRTSVGKYYVVTARDASKKERKDLYEKEK